MRTLFYVIIIFIASCFIDISGCKAVIESTIQELNTNVHAAPIFGYGDPGGGSPCEIGPGSCGIIE